MPSTVHELIFARLSNTLAVSNVVGSRIFVARAPQGQAYPLIVYQPEGAEHFPTFGAPVTLALREVRIFCWSESALQAEQLMGLVVAALHLWQPDPANESRCYLADDFDGSTEFDEDLQRFASTCLFIVPVGLS